MPQKIDTGPTITNSVIVGLDDSAASQAAHQWAVTYARATGKDLCVVHVLNWPIGLNTSAVKSGTRLRVPKDDVAEPYRRRIQRVFDEAGASPGSCLVFAQGDAGDVLVRLSTNADLLVVGTRAPVAGRPHVAGPVNQYCFSHASCPVAMVPGQLLPNADDLPDQGTRSSDLAVAGAS
jgi:nucleotide-binding universal stress UspA family protein